MFKWLKTHWPILFLAGVALVTAYMDTYIAQHFLDGDTSDFLHNAWVMAQQRNPFPRNYYGSTEPRLLDVAFVFSLFFAVTSDWTLVRILGTVLMQALYAASFLFMTRRAGIGKRARYVAAGFLLLPFSTSYARVVLYHLYYLLYLTTAFWMVGLTLWVMQALRQTPRRAWLPGGLLVLLWLWAGVNGIRLMLILVLPLLAFGLVQLYRALNARRVRNWQELRPFLLTQGEPAYLLGVWGVCCAAFLVGLVICKRVVLPYFGVIDSSAMRYRPHVQASLYAEIFNGLMSAIGVRDSSLPLIGIRGLSLAAALLGFFGLLTLSVREGLLGQETPFPSRLLLSLLGASFVTTTLVFLFVSDELHYFCYYVPVTAMLFPVLAAELESVGQKGSLLARRALAGVTCLCLLFQSGYTLWYLRVDKGSMDTFSGMPFPTLDAVDEVRDCVAFMNENGYTHAVIDYWYANVMMEMSDGALTVAPETPFESTPVTLHRWGTSHAAIDTLPYPVLVFIRKAKEEVFEERYPQAPKVHEGWRFDGYEISSALLH